ncbi:MAG: class I SAM-dependent methyltransferase [Armatimonadetes bacterium]|jgi:ubiquinone/menaquinone biosynthesis C-methylase UbiE|nr:class I SAM-dependent methyltransferase [Armatimonadota bacterium]
MSTNNNQFFDVQALGYDKPGTIQRAEAVAEQIRRQLPIRSDMSALDYGAGTGLVSFALRPYLHSITAADNSQGMLEILRKKIESQGVDGITPVLCDLSEHGLDGARFDLIYSSMTMHHIPDVPGLLKTMYNLLKPGGFIAISDLDAEDGSFHLNATEVHHHGFEREEIMRLLEQAGFLDVKVVTAHKFSKEVEGGDVREFSVFLATGRFRG